MHGPDGKLVQVDEKDVYSGAAFNQGQVTTSTVNEVNPGQLDQRQVRQVGHGHVGAIDEHTVEYNQPKILPVQQVNQVYQTQVHQVDQYQMDQSQASQSHTSTAGHSTTAGFGSSTHTGNEEYGPGRQHPVQVNALSRHTVDQYPIDDYQVNKDHVKPLSQERLDVSSVSQREAIPSQRQQSTGAAGYGYSSHTGSSGFTRGSNAGTGEGEHGPHSSRTANALDPRVDSDRSDSHTLGQSGYNTGHSTAMTSASGSLIGNPYSQDTAEQASFNQRQVVPGEGDQLQQNQVRDVDQHQIARKPVSPPRMGDETQRTQGQSYQERAYQVGDHNVNHNQASRGQVNPLSQHPVDQQQVGHRQVIENEGYEGRSMPGQEEQHRRTHRDEVNEGHVRQQREPTHHTRQDEARDGHRGDHQEESEHNVNKHQPQEKKEIVSPGLLDPYRVKNGPVNHPNAVELGDKPLPDLPETSVKHIGGHGILTTEDHKGHTKLHKEPKH